MVEPAMSDSSLKGVLLAIAEETTSAELATACKQIAEKFQKNKITFQDVVKVLSHHLTSTPVANLYRKHLSNFLLAIISCRVPLNHGTKVLASDSKKLEYLKNFILLAEVSDHPDILQYALKYITEQHYAPFQVYLHRKEAYVVAIKKRRLHEEREEISDKHIVTSCYSLLNKLPTELTALWDWSTFVEGFCNHGDEEIRWMVKQCMVILVNMTELQSRQLGTNMNVSDNTFLIANGSKVIASGSEVIASNAKDHQLDSLSVSVNNIDLSTENVINIDGIMLPLHSAVDVKEGVLVPVKSTLNNLRSLALAVASGKAMCLMGPVGSGKTSLVEYLAAKTGRKGTAFKKVQLGDQTDSRMLLGSHHCTDIPGEFVWKPGVLTEAVQNGHWLLLEDIDSAALDVASTLSSLLERNALCVPGYRDSLPIAPGFQLFVTQRTLVTNYGFQKKISNSSTLLQKHLTQINVEPLSRSELAEIIQTLYPSLKTICSRMIEVFMMFSMGSHDNSLQTTESIVESDGKKINLLRGSRLTSTRDLMKWCSRAVVGFDVTSPESALKVLQDALDIFTCSVSKPEDRLELSKKIGTSLGIVETKTEFYCKHYKPNVSLNPDALKVGRAVIPRKEKSLESLDFDTKDVVFSFTRQSACLLERIACCVTSNEPVLLVGETGTGKTSSVQYLAKQTGHKLVVINMNQQSDSADLLGGYKPVELKYVIKPLRNEFEQLFRSFYNVEKNKKFLTHINTCFETENWVALLALMKQSHKSAVEKMRRNSDPRLQKWLAFDVKLIKLEQQIKAAAKLTFAFIEGSLVRAMQEGYWVLLDEINLAAAEILECLAGLLEDKDETIDLLEKGDKVPIKRHPEFTLFACMNPATDVGKKDLPVGLRNRFTEFFLDELTEKNDLMMLIGDYLYHMNLSGSILESLYNFYSSIKKEAKLNLVDGAGNAPHYSLRTLCRALTAASKAKCGTVSRSLFEAFCLSFLTQLDSSSHPRVEAMIAKAVLGKKNIKSVINQLISEPKVDGQNFLLFEGHWIPQGKLDIIVPEGYILTPTVRKNLRDISRIISLSRLPVLLQGDTSVGKTSLVTYIAKASGNYCVRINNHEHTDLQEYIGSYAADANGKLMFKEGVLVEAMRKGYWIILDELNLAPSDVLEALNRVLDDNRELFIPETQQVVKADPNFMLFATQNPPGLYGGRKVLSRAFRNRFVELHFDEIPKPELEIILHQRCHVPPTYTKKMIAVMAELQIRRRGSAAVQGKDGFITLRDLFRWGQRYKLASKDILTEEKFYDWDQHISDEGYLVLAGKVRQTEERNIIEEVIEKHIKRKVNPKNLFTLHSATSPVTKPILEMLLNNQLEEFSHVVWTYNMRRLAVLIAKAFYFNEPVLLVGETGCGKTTICQILASLRRCELFSVNCHMHTESSDFLGGLRPVRQYNNDGRLFEWVDGPLVKAMERGHMFLADEISLADDSVLERLNSLLEPERQLVLAERGMDEGADIVVITAQKEFHFVGTMNPGGDFGKKELSPALRNRFTEIWCDSVTSREDLQSVLEKSVNKEICLANQEDGSSGIGNCILDFTEWLKSSEVTNKFPFSIRDLLSWVNFINVTVIKGLLSTPEAYVHGACMTFLDCFGTNLTGHIETETLNLLRKNAINFLLNQINAVGAEYTDSLKQMLSNKQREYVAERDCDRFGIKPFYIEAKQTMSDSYEDKNFSFTAPTTGSNTLRLLRGLQLNKAILLEGNPGVGKTSLVTALAKVCGLRVVRINLSDQTDITDLFGTDLPSEDGSFAFKEGAFLNALQNGDWILLDELNLAPQPVLEGLNACLDHRGEVYIPELGKTFKVKKQTRLFACQNPLKQGGARRGLPISFLNRFTQVYIDTLTQRDLEFIVESQYSSLPKSILHKIVQFNCKVSYEISTIQSWAHRGSPWEMNLRDIQRWCEALLEDQRNNDVLKPGKFVDMLYINRMRSLEDKQKMRDAYDKLFLPDYVRSDEVPQFDIENNIIHIGDVTIAVNKEKLYKSKSERGFNALILRNQLPILKALALNVKMNWLTILVGPTSTGKSSVIQVLADLTGNELHVLPVTSAMDVSDLLGGFEQVDYNRSLENLFEKLETLTVQTVRNIWLKQDKCQWKSNKLLNQIHEYKSIQSKTDHSEVYNMETEKFNTKIDFLKAHSEKLLSFNKDNHYLSEPIREIAKKLNKLKNKVAKLTSVNAGGKFEWVDSLLVKTMLEGSWLLLDNVNLTSAAVLDRLNGLLEPNGVLSIPVRGDICEIKPHPNFRIFFTMDPKHGEISRAMRNRGVEIFLLRPDEWDVTVRDTIPYMDLDALLSSCGLPSQYHDICLKCHENMSSFVYGLERPTVTHLLQAAHLTWQQLVRGIPLDKVLINSFSDVYIKPRCGGDFASNITTPLAEMKNNMLKTLQNIVFENNIQTEAKDSTHTLTVKGLCSNSNYELTKQICYIVNMDQNTVNSIYNIFTAYLKVRDVDLCHKIIKQDEIVSCYATIMSLNDHAHSKLKKLSTVIDTFNDLNLTCEAYQLRKSNCISILLYYELLKVITELSVERTSFSVIDYSKAVLSGTLTDDFVEYPILKYSHYYIQVVDEYVEKAVKSAEPCFDHEDVCRVIQLANWRTRFISMCSQPMFVALKNKRTQVLKEEIVPLLYMHAKWVQKHFMGDLFKILPPSNDLIEKFNNATKDLILNFNQENSEMIKLAKKMRKMCGQPKLYKDDKEFELSQARSKLHKIISLDIDLPIEKQMQKFYIDKGYINDGYKLALDVPDENVLYETEQNVNKILESCKGVTKIHINQKLLPINSYVIQRVMSLLQNYIQTNLTTIVNKDKDVYAGTESKVLSYLVQMLKSTNGFSSELLSLLQLFVVVWNGAQENLDQSLSSACVNFWMKYYNEISQSPAFYPKPFMIPKTDESLDLPISNSKRVSPDLALMPYYVQKLTVFANSAGSRPTLAFEHVSLAERAEYSVLLETLRNVMWQNMATCNAVACNKLYNDAVFMMKNFEQLTIYINKSLTENQEILGFETNILNQTLSLLSKYFNNLDTAFLIMYEEATRIYTLLQGIATQISLTLEEKNKIKVSTAQLSLLTNLLTLKIMSEISPVDHIEKYRLKVKYIDEDIKVFDSLLSAYYMHGIVSGTIAAFDEVKCASEVKPEYYGPGNPNRDALKRVHPYCGHILELKETTASRIHKYASGNTFRPKEHSYYSFVKECKHFTKSVLNSKTTEDISSNLISISNTLCECLKTNATRKEVLHKAQTVTKETASWLFSINMFSKKVESIYSEAFPDLAKPLQSSLSQICYSVTTMNDLVKEFLVKLEQGPILIEVAEDLMRYPVEIPNGNYESHLNRFVSSKLVHLLNKNVSAVTDDAVVAEKECLDVLKMNLTELKMHCYATEKVDSTSFAAVLTTLNAIVRAWDKQQRDIERKKIDDDALYVTKSKCEDENEEQQSLDEIQEMFPSFSDQDFYDFKGNSLEQNIAPKQHENRNKVDSIFNTDDVTLVYNWHSKFVRNVTWSQWLPVPKKMAGIDVVSSLLQRYPVFSRVMQNGWDAMDAEFEGVISPTLMVLVSQIKAKVDGEDSSSTKLDFYKSPWVSEIRTCYPLLQTVKESVNLLLDQWPDFPTLKDIIVIVDRILNFPVTSPVSRFLTGLELLRDKIEEWNKNAHKGNNLIDISLAVGQQIVNWRKLEMSNWKECLNNLNLRKSREAHKYWFYLYSVVDTYLNDSETIDDSKQSASPERVISVLSDFIEKSNVAEFESRLDIVYVYHCHLVHFESSQRRDELISILWNTYNYYSQFSPTIASQLKEKRSPIEKKLKDFVKICTWDRDLSYWSVKDTVDKAHKALHKHCKEFEKVLEEPVLSSLVDTLSDVTSEHVGIWDRPKRTTVSPNSAPGGAYMIDVQNFLVMPRNVKKYLDQSEQPSPLITECSLLNKIPSLLNKAKTLCKDTIANTKYPSLVQGLDDFVTMVIETNNHLGALEVEASAPKEKQTSQAKSILQQKRKGLADLFRYLTRMGLNYRTGLVMLTAADHDLYDFTIPPLDLDAALSYLKNRRCDASLSLLWSGCEKYFQKNIVRHKNMTTALFTPHQDLGIQNIERCKGFSAQLLKVTNSQKRSIAKYSRHLCDLRTLTTNITSVIDTETDCNIVTLKDKIDLLSEYFGQCSLSLEQFIVVLNSCPEKTLSKDNEPNFDSIITDSPIANYYKNSDEWKKTHGKIKTLLSSINKHKASIAKLRNSNPKGLGNQLDIPIVSQNHIDVTNEAKDCINKIKDDLHNILEENALRFKITQRVTTEHPIIRSIVDLNTYTDNTLKKIDELESPLDASMEDSNENRNEIISQTEDIIATMLLLIQSVYKKHLPIITTKTSESSVLDAIDEIIDDKSESKEILEDNHLKDLLQDKLTTDVKTLQIEGLNKKLHKLLTNYVEYITMNKEDSHMKNAVIRLVPILEQTMLFVQYFITQKVAVHRVSCKMLSVLLKIFTELSKKGFCKPSDLDMEDGDGDGGPGKMTAGTGLGEGEGQTDVSERIENQDQLDDAHRPGEEKKDEQRDCKEEEKGVNMTDDFDSHLQDVDKKDGEESDQDDNDEADKQMGDTETAADKLDQQIWGSEDEEEPDEQQGKKEKEEKGAGESTGEKEMAAKDEEKGTDDGAEGKDKKEKKDINEMDEPEVDDDHVDPYHGNHQPMPEAEDFDLPENMDLDGEEPDDKEDGETETENPFDLDVMKENITEELEEGKEPKNDEGLEVSSDEDDGAADGDDAKDKQDQTTTDDKDQNPENPEEEADLNKEDDSKQDPDQEDTNENDAQEEEQSEIVDESKENENVEEDKGDEQRNPEQIDKDDELEQKKQESNPQADPSTNDPSAQDKAENAEMDRGVDDNVQTNPEQEMDEDAAPFEQAQEQVGEERQASGRSQLDKSDKGHAGHKQTAPKATERLDLANQRRENKPGATDQQRTLGDVNEKKHKQTHTLNVEREEDGEEAGQDDEGEREADAYQHVKQAQTDDMQAIDAATKEQAEQQPTLQQDDEDADKLKDDETVPMDVDEDIEVEKSDKKLTSETQEDSSEPAPDKSGKNKDGGDEPTGETGVEVEGETVHTMNVPRGTESSYHTRLEQPPVEYEELSLEQYSSHRAGVQTSSSSCGHVGAGAAGAGVTWRGVWAGTAARARALTETLRLLLEPTGTTRRQGDYRTGRAINMRRVIPYIASHFRADRIWLRRTKPAKREYKIAIALDDSSSMSDNRSRDLAFESLALVSQALNLLEAGDLAVLSFGEQPNLLHPFWEQFSEHSGAKILDRLRFDQTKTKIAQLLDFCTVMFEEQAVRSDAVNAKLLVIVSDGRGIFSEGETRVLQAVRRAKQQGIFLVYVIIDNPDNKDSIMDIRRPLFDPVTNSLTGFVQYLDTFPFPFYIILRDMAALPTVLGDALRQWFELAANSSC